MNEHAYFRHHLERFIELQHQMPTQFLKQHGFQNINEIIVVVNNASQGIIQNGLRQIRNIRNYLINVRDHLYENYPFDYNDEGDAFESHEEKLELVNYLIYALEIKNFMRIVGVIHPDELNGIRQLASQKHIPGDIERLLIENLGTIPRTRGGRKSNNKSKRKTQKTQKARETRKSRK